MYKVLFLKSFLATYTAACAVSLGVGLPPSLAAQASLNPLSTLKIRGTSHPELTKWLSRPGGLQEAAAKSSHLVVDLDTRVNVSMDLPGLTAASQVIVLGRSLDRYTVVDGQRNTITTKYKFKIEETYKGQHLKQCIVSVLGGSTVFPGGHSAELRSIETLHLSDGHYFLLWLQPAGEEFVLSNGIEAVMQLKLPEGKVLPISIYDGASHVIGEQGLGSLKSVVVKLNGLSAPIKNAQK